MEQAGASRGLSEQRLIAALATECRVEKIKIEDWLNALRDLIAETLKAGGNITLGRIGYLRPRNGATRKLVMFQLSPELANEIGLPEPESLGPLCITCKKNPRAPRRKECSTCRQRRHRANKKRSAV